MAKWIVAGLIVLNLLLGMGIYMRLGGERTAQAQIGAARGEIEEVAGSMANNTTTVYILQVTTGKLAALQIDPVKKTTTVVAQADVSRALQAIR